VSLLGLMTFTVLIDSFTSRLTEQVS
jgi:hypothetical protein